MPETTSKNRRLAGPPFSFQFERNTRRIKQGGSESIPFRIYSRDYEGFVELSAEASHSSGSASHGAKVSVMPSPLLVAPGYPRNATALVRLDSKSPGGTYGVAIKAKSIGRTPGRANIVNGNDKRILRHFLEYAARHGIPAEKANATARRVEGAITALEPRTSYRPAVLRAVLWAMDHLGDKDYGKANELSIPGLETAYPHKWKCNYFAASAYGLGGGIGFGGNGYPTTTTKHLWRHDIHPEPAELLAAPSQKYIGPFERIKGAHSKEPVDFQIGDIVAFEPSPGHTLGHVTIGFAENILIYAGEEGVKLGTVESVWKDHVGGRITIRRYKKK